MLHAFRIEDRIFLLIDSKWCLWSFSSLTTKLLILLYSLKLMRESLVIQQHEQQQHQVPNSVSGPVSLSLPKKRTSIDVTTSLSLSIYSFKFNGNQQQHQVSSLLISRLMSCFSSFFFVFFSREKRTTQHDIACREDEGEEGMKLQSW